MRANSYRDRERLLVRSLHSSLFLSSLVLRFDRTQRNATQRESNFPRLSKNRSKKLTSEREKIIGRLVSVYASSLAA